MKKSIITIAATIIITVMISTAAQASTLGTRTLKTGMSGADVTELQQLLKRIGYFSGTSTGYYGDVTKASVLKFQAQYGLTKDGVAGGETIHKIKYENGVAADSFVYVRALSKDMSGWDVLNLQEVLIKLGYLSSASADKVFGSKTEAAVNAFKKNAGMAVDGIVGSVTAARINEALSGSGNSRGSIDRGSDSTGQTVYTVQAGDTLWVISKKFNVTTEQLKQANNLTTDMIYPGQSLKITAGGSGTPTAPSISYNSYSVKAGDTIWSIANTNGIPQADLMKANGFNSNTVLYIGQVIKVPVYNIPVKTTPGPQYGELLDWWTEAQYVVPFNTAFTVIDFATGTSFRAMRTFGANHADCEPLTAQDTAAIRNLWNKYHTSYWTTRPVIIEINGRRLAASMSAMFHAGLDSAPNGAYVDGRSGDYGYGQNFDAIKGNNADGHFDIHFLNSTTHNTGKVNSAHQANVKIAAGLQ